MNNDDHFKKNTPELTSELEARVVAWVLGEASVFEAAQLEVLCAEQPELAVFKRRIEAVHGLMGEAAKPVKAPLRLSPERRARVLAVIGGEESAAGVPAGQEQPELARPGARPVKRSKILHWHSWALPMAACLTIMTFLAAVIIPTVGKVKKSAHRSGEVSARMQVEHRVAHFEAAPDTREVVDNSVSSSDAREGPVGVLGNREVSDYNQMNVTGSTSVSSESAPMVFFDKDKASAGQVSADAPPPASPVPTSAPMPSSRDDGRIVNTTVGGAGGQGYFRAQNQPLGGFSLGLDTQAKEMAVAAKPASKRQTVTITAGIAQEFTEREATGSETAESQRQFAAGFDPFAPPAAGRVSGAGAELDEKTKSAVAELKRVKARSQLVEEVSNSWQRPDVYKANATSTSGGKQVVDGFAMSAPMPDPVRQKLREIIIPQANFKDVPLSKVISSLSATSEEYDRSQENRAGANIVLLDPTAKDPSVSMSFRNLSLGRMLDLITESTGYRYEITEDTVVVRPKLATDFNMVFFPVTHAVMARMLKDSGTELVSGGESAALQALFQKEGVDFSISEAGVVYDGAAVIVNQTAANAERIRAILKRYQDAQ